MAYDRESDRATEARGPAASGSAGPDAEFEQLAALSREGQAREVQQAYAQSPKGGEKRRARTPAEPAAKRPAADAGLPTPGAGDIVLTRAAEYAKSEYVGWFSDQVKAKITGWSLAYDPSRVKLAEETRGETKAPVIVLSWDAGWGQQPTTSPVPLSLEPVDARAAVKGVESLAGWGQVAPADQTRVTALLGGETNKLSAAARQHLRGQFAGLGAQTEAQQAAAVKALIGNKDAMPGVVDEQVETTAVTYTLGDPTVVADYEFRGKKADAEKYEASFSDGAKIAIIAPKSPEPGHHQHTVAEAADAAAYLPQKSRAVVKEVVLNIVENPDDAYWAVEYDQADFHSYMTAGASGTITIYPSKSGAQPGDNYRRGTMIHETGHTWSYQQWGTDTTKGKWVDWKTAMDKDGNAVSGYAQASIAEDVAETVQIYGSTKGTPKYDEYKAMVPNRIAMLETELG